MSNSILFYLVFTILRVEVQQWKDECQSLISSQSEEGYEAEEVVEAEWCHHCSCHLWVALTDILIIVRVRTIFVITLCLTLPVVWVLRGPSAVMSTEETILRVRLVSTEPAGQSVRSAVPVALRGI